MSRTRTSFFLIVRRWFTHLLADTLLLYPSRCYVVWNRNKRVLIGPAILFVATTVCEYLVSSPTTLVLLSRVYISQSFVLNIILTTLIGTLHFFGQGSKPNAISKSDMVDITIDKKDHSSRTLAPICFYLDDIVCCLVPYSVRSNIAKSIGLNLDLFTLFIWSLISHSIQIRLEAFVSSSPI